MEDTNKTPTEVSRVAVLLPPFWTEGPAVWFTLAKAQFSVAGFTEDP
jgi:hypothetical protein